MGLFERFKSAAGVAALVETGRTASGAVASPWTDRSALARVILDDLAGVQAPATFTRAEGMRVPALARARAVICGTLARQPLAMFEGGALVPAAEQPAWLSTTTSRQAPRTRLLWTLDDVFWYGTSLWIRRNDPAGRLVDAFRPPRNAWRITDAGLVEIAVGPDTYKPADAADVILFEGPQEGMLTLAADGIRASHDMRHAWTKRVESPAPLVELHNTDPLMALEDDEITALLTQWEAARKAGGTAYTPAQIQANIHGSTPTDLFTAGRNAERLDFGNWSNLSAAVLDGSLSTASLTYSTQEGNRSELVDISLAYWANPLEARLSLDDVTPAGTRIGFDLTYMTLPAATTAPAGTPFQD